MKKYKNDIIAASMAALLMITGMTGCTSASAAMRSYAAPAQTQETESETENADLDEVTDQLQEAASNLLKDHSQEDGKTETVYIVAGTDGKAKETIVSNWLKNPKGLDELEDVSELKDITNTKGNETFEADGNKLVWQAGGKDIWYQGKTDKQLPLTTKITYELDGKKISAEELAGKDGHLKMTFSYENHMKTQREVNGEKVTMYQPFSVVSGFLADTSKMTDLTVSRGRIVTTGDYTIVLGMAFPGLEESLGLDELTDEEGNKTSLNIPEDIVIEGDVTDFSLTTAITLYENTLLNDLNLEDVSTLDDLKEKMNELTDGSQKLADGSKELSDGVGSLNDGAKALDEGAGKLEEGTGKLADGSATLDQGAKALDAGAGTLEDGVTAADAGAGQLKTGADQLNSGAGSLSEGTKALSSGASQLDAGIGQLAAQTETLPDAVKQLHAGAA